MSNISTKINLAGLVHAVQTKKSKSGMVECLVIPIDQNFLYRGEKGLYLDLTHFEIMDKSKFAEGQKDTHLVKQSLPKDVYENMSEDQRKAFPILGSTIVWGGRNEIPLASPISEDDDLPF